MTELCKPFDEKMRKTIEVVKGDFASVRAGRANAGVLDRIQVEYYGTPTPIQQVASISTPDPRTLAIQPWDASILKAIEKAIQASDLGINPQNDGRIIRLSFPQLTQERRVELTKQVRKYGENGKVAIRNIRRDAMESFKDKKKKSEITGPVQGLRAGDAGHYGQALQGDRRADCGKGKGTDGSLTPPGTTGRAQQRPGRTVPWGGTPAGRLCPAGVLLRKSYEPVLFRQYFTYN